MMNQSPCIFVERSLFARTAANDDSMNARVHAKARRAFSLVEMLLVVALLALLISILMPSMTRARESTRRSVCASNLRQLVNGTLMYAAANRTYLVGEGIRTREGQDPNYANDPAWRAMWVGWVSGYTVESCTDAFYCPSMAPNVQRTTAWPVQMPWGGEYLWGYPYFGHYLNATNDRATNWGGTLPSARRTSAEPRTPLFADWNRGDQLGRRWGMISHAQNGGLGPYADTYGGTVPHMSAPPWTASAALETNIITPEGANNALLDASVQWFKPADFEIAVHSYFLWAKTVN